MASTYEITSKTIFECYFIWCENKNKQPTNVYTISMIYLFKNITMKTDLFTARKTYYEFNCTNDLNIDDV